MEWYEDQAKVEEYVAGELAHDERLRRERELEAKAEVKSYLDEEQRIIQGLSLADATEEAQTGVGLVSVRLDGKTQVQLEKWGVLARDR